MKKNILLFFIICGICIPHHAIAAAWLQKQGKGQVITTLSYYRVDHPDIEPFSKKELDLLAETGITDDITIGVNPHIQKEPGQNAASSGKLFTRVRLWHNDHGVFSVQPLLQLPGTYRNAHYTLTNQDSATRAELRLLAGYSGRYYFLDNELAYNKAFGSAPDEWHIDSTLGIHYSPALLVLLQLFQSYDAHGNDITRIGDYTVRHDTTKSAPLLQSSFDHVAKISVVHPITNSISIEAGTFTHILNKKAWLGDGILLSMWVDF